MCCLILLLLLFVSMFLVLVLVLVFVPSSCYKDKDKPSLGAPGKPGPKRSTMDGAISERPQITAMLSSLLSMFSTATSAQGAFRLVEVTTSPPYVLQGALRLEENTTPDASPLVTS